MVDLSSALFSDPNIDYPNNNPNLPFSDYITKWKKIISDTRIDLTAQNAERIIEANAPFELRPKTSTPPKNGALLIHGLFDSPFQLRDVGNTLQANGLLVRAIVLPGHGTVPGALLHVDHRQWLKAVQYGINSLKNEVENVFIVGYSTGASLALYQMAQDHTSIAGIILISPALKIRSKFVPYANALRILGKRWQRAAWFHLDKHETLDYAKYRSIACNAVYQVHDLTKAITRSQPNTEPNCPLFFLLSEDDKTVCAATVIDYFKQHTHPQSRLLLYTNKNTCYDDQRIIPRNSAYPHLNIVNFSHTCLPISPNNQHYGKQGDYAYASRITDSNNVIFGEFLRNEIDFNALMMKCGIARLAKQRLTFNPDYDHMSNSMHDFIKTIADA